MEIDQQDTSWAVTEFGDASLNDPRRTQRLIEIATLLAGQPTASLPQACSDKAMLKATYRFFNNDAIDPTAILSSHIEATADRVAEMPWVLAVQDTTDLDFTHHPTSSDLGPLFSANQHGLFAHTTLAVTPDRTPQGIIGQQVWARDPDDVGKKARRKTTPIVEKESYKWLNGLCATIDMAVQSPNTHFVAVADREADIYDLFIAERPDNVDLLVRAAWNRRVDHPEQYLWAKVMKQPVVTHLTIEIPPRHGQQKRFAKLAIRFCPLSLCPPRHRRNEQLATVKVWAVSAIETDAPDDVEPIEWLLLSTLPVADASGAVCRISWYTCRWTIETFHKVLKSGCRIEGRHLQTAARLKRCLAVLSVVAWRILYATMLSRSHPDTPCTAVLAPEEWQALYCRIYHTTECPKQPPPLRQAVRWIAQLGGFLGRRGDGEPGVTVLWKGFMQLAQLVAMYCIFRPSDPG